MSELLARVRHTLYNVLVELISNSDGYWHDWETWTTCNEPCGTALRFKLRKCVVSHNGGTCDGQPVIVGMCNDLCSGKYNCSAKYILTYVVISYTWLSNTLTTRICKFNCLLVIRFASQLNLCNNIDAMDKFTCLYLSWNKQM